LVLFIKCLIYPYIFIERERWLISPRCPNHLYLCFTANHSSIFLTGNLKHKDLAGQVVSSQAYVDDQNNNVEENSAEAVDDDEPAIVSSEEDREVE
jgi:hypothetical protein